MSAVVRAVGASKAFAASTPLGRTLDRLARGGRRSTLPSSSGLREVSFELGPGEWLGVVGHNGAAKTTLLRLVAGLYRPTAGLVEVRGRVVLLAGLGIGMIDDLSVRENVTLYGTINGMRRAETRRRLHEILAWAGLAEFADARVGTLSSGMRARLAFSCIRHAEGQVWLFDEVLSTGDREFRQQCGRHFEEMRRTSATVLIATHSLEFVRRYCQRALWLERGATVALGPATEVVNAYERDRAGHARATPAPAAMEAVPRGA